MHTKYIYRYTQWYDAADVADCDVDGDDDESKLNVQKIMWK